MYRRTTDDGVGCRRAPATQSGPATPLRAFASLLALALTAAAAAPETNGWMSLFDGRTLDGWRVCCTAPDTNKVFWRAEEGAIVCDSTGRPEHDYVWLLTERTFSDFELELRFQAFRGVPGNSGVQIRSRYDASPSAPRGGWLDGPQIDIHPPAPWRTGLIYDETRGVQHWIHPKLPGSAIEPRPTPPGWTFRYADEGDGWNRLRIECRGTRIVTALNGVTISDFDGAGVLDDEVHRTRGTGMDGHIALQLHTRDQLKIRFKDIRVRPLR